jgi:hypothetical protein
MAGFADVRRGEGLPPGGLACRNGLCHWIKNKKFVKLVRFTLSRKFFNSPAHGFRKSTIVQLSYLAVSKTTVK